MWSAVGREDGRFGTLQNPVDVGGGAPLKIRIIHIIGHQTTGVSDFDRIGVHRWQSIAGREFAESNEYAFSGHERSLVGEPMNSGTERIAKVKALSKTILSAR